MLQSLVAHRHKTPADLRGRCQDCWLLQPFCICAEVPSVPTESRFLVLRHAKERWRTTNSGRIAALAMPRCTVVDYGVEGTPPLDLSLIEDDAWLLFPDPELESPEAPGPAQIVVPDGNWRQAKRLAKKLDRTGRLRRLSLHGHVRAPGLRRTHVPENLATLEAIAACVELFESKDKAEALRRLYARMVEASLAGRCHPY